MITTSKRIMLENFKLFTVTHKSAALAEIKHFVINGVEGEALKSKLTSIKTTFGIDELFYLPTCNRVLYLAYTPNHFSNADVANFFEFINPSIPDSLKTEISNKVIHLEGLQAVEHLFGVASSIDSLVVGEREILRQLREAYDKCKQWAMFGEHLKLVLDKAVLAAKTVYSKTRIGEKPVSVVSLATQKLLSQSLTKDAKVVMIGAGQTNNLMGKFLSKHHFENITIFNRTYERAQQLAELVGGRALPFESISQYKEGFDCLIVCTGATSPIVDQKLYRELLNGSTAQKVVIDLSIPHNIDKEVIENNPIHYIEIEGLKSLANENLAFREKEVIKAKSYIDQAVSEFPKELKQRHLEIALRQIPIEVKAVKQKAFAEVFSKEIQMLDDQSLDLLQRMMSYMEKKCIGIPMKVAREAVIST